MKMLAAVLMAVTLAGCSDAGAQVQRVPKPGNLVLVALGSTSWFGKIRDASGLAKDVWMIGDAGPSIAKVGPVVPPVTFEFGPGIGIGFNSTPGFQPVTVVDAPVISPGYWLCVVEVPVDGDSIVGIGFATDQPMNPGQMPTVGQFSILTSDIFTVRLWP